MPFKSVIDPQQLITLRAALDDYCRIAGIRQGTPEQEQAGLLILSLYHRGATTAEALAVALENFVREAKNARASTT